MLQAALQRNAFFRKEWWKSCQVHNPGWAYKLWDYESAVEFISSKYPHFLDLWKSYPKPAMQSDVLRVMVLQTYGGVYLDADNECFTSIEQSLLGYHLVVQVGKVQGLPCLYNSPLASIPQHPFWDQVLADMLSRSNKRDRFTVSATGPRLVNRAFMWAAKINMTQLKGVHQLHMNSSNSSLEVTTAMVYGSGSWFMPCEAEDGPCLQRAAAAPYKFRHPSSPVVGTHHYAKSWAQGSKVNSSLTRIHDHMAPIANFLTNSSHFVEAQCLQQLYLPPRKDITLNGSSSSSDGSSSSSSSSTQAAAPPATDAYYSHPVCWDVIQQEVQNGSCVVFSFKEAPTEQAGSQTTTRVDLEANLGFELSLADAGCHIHLFTNAPLPANISILTARPPGRIEVANLLLRAAPDPFHPQLPADTLDNIMATTNHSRLTLLLMQNMGHQWEVGSQLYLSNSQALAATRMLLLEFLEPLPSQLHHVHTFYQHVYQEAGMVGFARDVFHSPAAAHAWRHNMRRRQRWQQQQRQRPDYSRSGESPMSVYRLGFRSMLPTATGTPSPTVAAPN